MSNKIAVGIATAYIFLWTWSGFAVGNTNRPFIVVSPPKSGTHLIGKSLSMIVEAPVTYFLGTDLPNDEKIVEYIESIRAKEEFVVGHPINEGVIQLLLERNYKIIFVQRDPRDILMSALHYIRAGCWGNPPVTQLSDINEQIEDMITGWYTGWRYLDWGFLSFERGVLPIPHDLLFVSHFEDLVGAKGGGSDDRQRQIVFDLAAFLEVESPQTMARVDNIVSQIFGNTITFFRGQAGGWKKDFTERHKALFKEHYNDLLIRLGYETDDQW
jgi:hypothetical protein